MFRFLDLHTVFYRTHIDNSSFWTEVIYILYKYSINNNNNNAQKASSSSDRAARTFLLTSSSIITRYQETISLNNYVKYNKIVLFIMC